MTELGQTTEIQQPLGQMGDTITIEDLVNRVSLIKLIPVPKQKANDIELESKGQSKSADDACEISAEKKENVIVEENNCGKTDKGNKIERTCGKDPKAIDFNQNVFKLTSVDDVIEQTNSLTLEDDETDASDTTDNESESEEVSTRGPDLPRRNQGLGRLPYSRPIYTPNENNFDYSILSTSFTENVIIVDSLLSGGGILAPDSNDEEKIKNGIKEFLESPEIYDLANNTSSGIINFDDLEDLPSLDISLLDEDEFRNDIVDFIVDKSDTSSRLSSFSSYSNVSSPVSSCGDQVVFSPNTSYPEQTSTPTLYPTIENSLSPKMINVNDDCFLFTDLSLKPKINSDTQKEILILPKLDLNKINNTDINSNTRIKRATGPRNIYLSHINKKTRDSYHKIILKLDLLKRDADGRTFLHNAILVNNADFATYLAHLMKIWINKSPKPQWLENTPDIESFVNIQDNGGHTALYISTLCNQLNVCGYLFEECNADIEIANKEGQTPLHVACQKGEKFLKIIQIFTKEPSKINLKMRNSLNRTPLHEAVNYHSKTLVKDDNTTELIDNLSIVQHLLASGARIDDVDKYGLTPIHIAVKNRRIDMLEKLHECGVLCGFDEAINQMDYNSKTAFDLARSDETNPEWITMLDKLLSYGAMPSPDQ